MFNLKVSGLDVVLSQIHKKGEDTKKMLSAKLAAFGDETANDAKLLAPTDEGELKRMISAVKTGLKVTISVNVDYAAYVEFGTRSFAAAHVASLPAEWKTYASQFKGKGGGDYFEFLNRILDWVIRKGIANRYSVKTRKKIDIKLGSGSSDEKRLEETAYAIALSIMRKGIRPHPYLIPAFEKNKIELIKRLKAEL